MGMRMHTNACVLTRIRVVIVLCCICSAGVIMLLLLGVLVLAGDAAEVVLVPCGIVHICVPNGTSQLPARRTSRKGPTWEPCKRGLIGTRV